MSGIGRRSEYLIDNDGFIPYAEICANLNNNQNWRQYFDDGRFATYAVFDDQWVSYDTPETVLVKVHLAKNKQLSGLNYASIDSDDFMGQCGGVTFPLVQIGYEGIVNGVRTSCDLK